MSRNLSRQRGTQPKRGFSRGLSFEQLESRQLLTTIQSIQALNSFDITGNVGEKPESKIWKHGGNWWGVFSDTVGTHVWRLDGTTWNKTLQISNDVGVHVDVKSQGNVAHILFENDLNSKLASIQFVPGTVPNYQLWSARPTLAGVPLAEYVESATLDIDSTGRMWVAYQDQISAVIPSVSSEILVRYSDAPYNTWSEPISLASGIYYDDISALTALPGGKIGVMWSNQTTDRFGFRVHVDGTDPTVWSADELPGSQSAQPVGNGFADDHINLAVASDGTLYAAVKTSYDTPGSMPVVGILVRRPNGVWDNFYPVSYVSSTRPSIQLNEVTHTLIYSYDDDLDWAYRECSTVTMVCSAPQVLLASGKNATSTKQNVTKDLVVLTSSKTTTSKVTGVLLRFDVANSAPVVDAGPNQTIYLQQAASLNGFVEDDGLPDPPNAASTTWTKVSGPGTVTFGNAASSITTATFSVTGTYTLRLGANDGTLTNFDDVTINVIPVPPNQPPAVAAGPDITIGIAQSPLLSGTITDDGFPLVPGTVSAQWSKVSGPGTVTFGTPTSKNTTATFGAIGTYTVRLTAFDGALTTTDDLVVTVNTLPPNLAPVVNAGLDQSILLSHSVTLNGTVTDDDTPIPSPTVPSVWSKVSGPGTVSFLNASARNTTAIFGQSGTYVLALTANDTLLSGSDSLVVTVLDNPPTTTIAFQDGASPTTTYAGTRDTKVRSDQPTTIFGTGNKLEVDGNPDFSTLLKWDISSVPTTATVLGASFTVNVIATTNDSFKIYEILKDWLESQTTFNQSLTGVPWQVAGVAGATDRGSTVLGAITAPALGLATVQLNAAGIAVVQNWVTNPANNRGLIIQDYTDAFTDGLDFNARDLSTNTLRPKFSVTYTTFPINDPPVIGNLGGDTQSYTENSGPQTVDLGTAAIVSDPDSPDFASGNLTVSVATGGAASQDVLSIRSAGNISFDGTNVRYQGTVIGTAAGGADGEKLVITLNLASTTTSLTALLNAITYENISDNPTVTPRTITLSLNDGDGTVNGGTDTTTVTTTVNTVAVNDAPVLVNIGEDELPYVENSGSRAIDVDIPATVVDFDSPNLGGGSLIASLGATGVATQDVLSILPAGPITLNGTAVSFQGTQIGTVSGGSNGTDLSIAFTNSATPSALSALLDSIAYQNTSEDPVTNDRIVYLTLNDGDGIANGGTDTESASMTISVLAINDPPVISNLSGDLLSYLGNSGIQILDRGTGAQLTDPDSANLSGGQLTVAITSGGVSAEDVLSVKHAGVGFGQIGFAGNTVFFEGIAIGTATGGSNSNPLVIALNSSTSAVAVSALLSAIAYTNSSASPNAGQRTVTWVLTDGDGTIEGGIDAVTVTTLVNFTTNNAPVFLALNGGANYIEDAAPVQVDPDAEISEVDLDLLNNYSGATLTVSRQGGANGNDSISLSSGAVSLSGSNVMVGGNVVATLSQGPGNTLALGFNSNATASISDQVLQAVRYANTSQNPPASVVLAYTFNGSSAQVVGAATVSITSVNDAPGISNLSADTLTHLENTAPAIIDQGLAASITDVDSSDFGSGSLTVTIVSGGAPAQDVLSVRTVGNITTSGTTVNHLGTAIGTWAGGTGAPLVISLNSTATAGATAALLGAIGYANSSDAPVTAPRQVSFTLNDGDGTLNGGSATATAVATVNVTAINDAPGITNLTSDVLTYFKGSGPKVIDQGTAALVADIDSPDFATGSLTVAITTGGVAVEDVLAIQALGGISVSGANVSSAGTVIGTVAGGTNGNSLVVSFNSAATPAAVSALVHAVSYQNTATNPPESSRVVTYTVVDGDGVLLGGFDTATATATVAITAFGGTPTSIAFQTGLLPTTAYKGTLDTKVRADQPTNSFGTNSKLEMDGKPDIESFIKYDISAIPSGSLVQSASLTINVLNTSLDTFFLYQLLRPWSESTATFNEYATGFPWQIAGAQGALDRGSTVLGTLTAPTLGSTTINLNSAGVGVVQSWIDNPATNFGLVFQNFLDASTDDLDFSSSNEGTKLLRPKLAINYLSGGAGEGSPGSMTNPSNPLDVNNDSVVSPSDVLIVINWMNYFEANGSFGESLYYPDVTGDGQVVPIDVLTIINYLSQVQVIDSEIATPGVEGGEGEAFFPAFGDDETASAAVPLLQTNGDALILAGISFASSATGDIGRIELTPGILGGAVTARIPRERSVESAATWIWDTDDPDPKDSPELELEEGVHSANLDAIRAELLAFEPIEDPTELDCRAAVFAGWPASNDGLGCKKYGWT